MNPARAKAFASLPAELENESPRLVLRRWAPDDVETLAAWPSYPFPYEPFNLRYRLMSELERSSAFKQREENPNRLTLVVDAEFGRAICYLALVNIDWTTGVVGTMAYRLHPDYCDKGIGTRIMQTTIAWCRGIGLSKLRLDVAGSNGRAVRCYEKSGFIITEEFWREDLALNRVNLDAPENEFLKPHVRQVNGAPQIRFYWMENNCA